MSNDCCFCAEFAGQRTAFHDLYPTLESRIVFETASLVVMPSLGQLAPGHMLLVPREHVTSFGELGPASRSEAWQVYSAMREALSRRFSPVICFEHGSPRGASAGGCGIVHAHVHIVPVDRLAAPRPPSLGHGWQPAVAASWLDDAAALAHRGGGYLMWHGVDAPPCLETAGHVPSQYLRRHVAGVLANARWDWRATGAQRELRSLVQDWMGEPVAAGIGLS